MTADQAKATADAMAALWEGEFPATANVLAAVTDEARDYKPDAKSRTAWELATHLATADIWFMDCIAAGRFEFDQEKAKAAVAAFGSTADVVAFYRKTFPEKLAALRAIPADRLTETIDFFSVMKKTRADWIGFANNHSVHHRGQLAAYLRAMGSKVPDIYGPSADSKPES
jgi:uncharacterized damage-inducible protein DinB